MFRTTSHGSSGSNDLRATINPFEDPDSLRSDSAEGRRPMEVVPNLPPILPPLLSSTSKDSEPMWSMVTAPPPSSWAAGASAPMAAQSSLASLNERGRQTPNSAGLGFGRQARQAQSQSPSGSGSNSADGHAEDASPTSPSPFADPDPFRPNPPSVESNHQFVTPEAARAILTVRNGMASGESTPATAVGSVPFRLPTPGVPIMKPMTPIAVDEAPEYPPQRHLGRPPHQLTLNPLFLTGTLSTAGSPTYSTAWSTRAIHASPPSPHCRFQVLPHRRLPLPTPPLQASP
ncbi:hypothetical protein DL93DRAFT_755099 [Clavulina sp. PMI_390]|nr:hypothetical protein DL93DRAFT_755099 [Clavulina sp. PMI_390]